MDDHPASSVTTRKEVLIATILFLHQSVLASTASTRVQSVHVHAYLDADEREPDWASKLATLYCCHTDLMGWRAAAQCRCADASSAAFLQSS